MSTLPTRMVHISINRPWRDVHAFAGRPQNLPRWAAGLASGVRQDGEEWIAEGTLGNVRIRFVPDNPYGLLDHDVVLPSGQTVSNPLRVVANGNGAEVIFTLFRQPGMSDADFEADAAAVERDLAALKTIMEAGEDVAVPDEAPVTAIDYVELNVADIAASKAFYGEAFGWTFTDYGPVYCEFDSGRLKGGFTTLGPVKSGGPLVILYAGMLEDSFSRVEKAGGAILAPITAFPGGRRFHFADPDGYELAVWSKD